MSEIDNTIEKLKYQVAELEQKLAATNVIIREHEAHNEASLANFRDQLRTADKNLRERNDVINTLRADLARYDQGMNAVDVRARAVMKTAGFGAGGIIGKPTDIIDLLDLFLDALTNKRIQESDTVPRYKYEEELRRADSFQELNRAHQTKIGQLEREQRDVVPRSQYNKEKARADEFENDRNECHVSLKAYKEDIKRGLLLIEDYKVSFALIEKRVLKALTDLGLDHPFSITTQTAILDSIQEMSRKISNMAADKYRAVEYHDLLKVMLSEVQEASKLSGVHVVHGPTLGKTIINMIQDLAKECHALYVNARKDDAVRADLKAATVRISELESQTFKLDAKNVELKVELEYERQGWGKLSNDLFGDEVHTLNDALGMFRDLRTNCDKVYRANIGLVAHGFAAKGDHLISLGVELKKSAETLKSL